MIRHLERDTSEPYDALERTLREKKHTEAGWRFRVRLARRNALCYWCAVPAPAHTTGPPGGWRTRPRLLSPCHKAALPRCWLKRSKPAERRRQRRLPRAAQLHNTTLRRAYGETAVVRRFNCVLVVLVTVNFCLSAWVLRDRRYYDGPHTVQARPARLQRPVPKAAWMRCASCI